MTAQVCGDAVWLARYPSLSLPWAKSSGPAGLAQAVVLVGPHGSAVAREVFQSSATSMKLTSRSLVARSMLERMAGEAPMTCTTRGG